ncbi:MAG TPA: hypothetical protein VF103_16215, partial [Polyangiaceae bacterium]
GRVVSLSRIDVPAVRRYQSTAPRGSIRDVTALRGDFLAGAGAYGAISLVLGSDGRWTEQVYPGSFTEASSAVASTGSRRYLLQPDFQRVIGRAVTDTAYATALSGAPFDELVGTAQRVAAAAGDRLYVASPDGTNRRDLAVSPGNEIVGLASAGNVVLVSTANGAIVPVDPALIDTGTAVGSPIVTGLTEPARILASNGDYLYYAVGSRLDRVALSGGAAVSVNFGSQITTASVDGGSVYVGNAASVFRLPAAGTFASPESLFNAGRPVTAVVADGDRVFVGHGEQGVSLYELARSKLSVSAALLAPQQDQRVALGQEIPLRLTDLDGINSVRYRVDGMTVASLRGPPFDTTAVVPSNLRNGQPFFVQGSVESVWGDVIESAPRRVLLHSESVPANATLAVTLQATGGWVTRPVELLATVVGSLQPISQVEFYDCGAADPAPCTLLGRSYGPEFDLSVPAGPGVHRFKARVIDIYGNTRESELVPLTRLSDSTPPRAPTFRLEGELQDGAPLAGFPFTVIVNVADDQSGVGLAMLRRDGELLAVAFGNGELRYTEPPAGPNQRFDYTVYVEDRAGVVLTPEATQSYVAAPDPSPVITPDILPTTIREQERFNVQLRVSDNINVARIRWTWNGVSTEQTYVGRQNFIYARRDITDSRPRITAPTTGTLEIRAFDGQGQETLLSRTLTVVPDNPPNLAGLVVTKPASAIFGSNVPIFFNVWDRDDGGYQGLHASIVDVSTTPAREVFAQDNQSYVATSLAAPSASSGATALRFFVRLTDALGQTGDSAVFSVPLTEQANRVRFDNGGNPAVNPTTTA